MKFKRLVKRSFASVVKNTPLVSMDLIIKNKQGKYLLNLRGNPPAYNKWFFFGGRIPKAKDREQSFNEIFEEAFNELIEREFHGKLKADFKNTQFTKLMVHQYEEDFDGKTVSIEDGFQYVVLCYEFEAELLKIDIDYILDRYAEDAKKKKGRNKATKRQECLEIEWFSKDEILALPKAHEYIIKYFNEASVINFSAPSNPTSISTPYLPVTTPPKQNFELRDLLSLYQTQSKSLNNYTTVIWAFPLLFITALGTINYQFYNTTIVMLFSIGLIIFLLHAFYKHTYIHESLVKSVRAIEKRLKDEYQINSQIIPDFELIKEPFKYPSHKLVRGFLAISGCIYIVIASFLLIEKAIIWFYGNLVKFIFF
jgi:colanic acid biosynthesis protein WcaH